MTHENECDKANILHSVGTRYRWQVEQLVDGYAIFDRSVMCHKCGHGGEEQTGLKTPAFQGQDAEFLANFETRRQPSWYIEGPCFDCVNKLKGLILGGPVGCGKTHLAIAYGVQAVNKGKTVLFLSMPELLRMLKNDISLSKGSVTLDKAKTVDVLILDDAGIERGTDWANEQLYMIVDYRYGNGLPIVLTTNARGLDALQEDIGIRSQQICSRLVEMTEQAWIEVYLITEKSNRREM